MTLPTGRAGGGLERVIFLHVPKAAGTTLNRVIENQYPPESVLAIDPARQEAALEEFKCLPPSEREKIRLLRGHIGYGLHIYLPSPVTYITILRDPVDRVLSHYYYLRTHLERGSTFADRPWLQDAGRMSLTDYVRFGRSADLRNGQTKLLAGRMDGWGVDSTPPLDEEGLLQAARRNLHEGLGVVGLAERFDETLVLLKRRLGWKTPIYVSRNRTEGRPPKTQLPRETLEILEEQNALDLELYRDANVVFLDAIRDEGPRFSREVARLRFVNRRTAEARRLVTSARYRAKLVMSKTRAG